MSWKRVTIDATARAAGIGSKLQDEFAAIFMAAQAPPAAAMYGNLGATGPRDYYFSPAAAGLASGLLAAYLAVDCPAPDTRTLVVLVNNLGAGPAG